MGYSRWMSFKAFKGQRVALCCPLGKARSVCRCAPLSSWLFGGAGWETGGHSHLGFGQRTVSYHGHLLKPQTLHLGGQVCPFSAGSGRQLVSGYVSTSPGAPERVLALALGQRTGDAEGPDPLLALTRLPPASGVHWGRTLTGCLQVTPGGRAGPCSGVFITWLCTRSGKAPVSVSVSVSGSSLPQRWSVRDPPGRPGSPAARPPGPRPAGARSPR